MPTIFYVCSIWLCWGVSALFLWMFIGENSSWQVLYGAVVLTSFLAGLHLVSEFTPPIKELRKSLSILLYVAWTPLYLVQVLLATAVLVGALGFCVFLVATIFDLPGALLMGVSIPIGAFSLWINRDRIFN